MSYLGVSSACDGTFSSVAVTRVDKNLAEHAPR